VILFIQAHVTVASFSLVSVGFFIRNWKRRWFFLDAEAKELRYYKPPENHELLGRIPLRDVSRLLWASNHGGNVVRVRV
jgi:hypothetical protein